jgi:hypothetical protein
VQWRKRCYWNKKSDKTRNGTVSKKLWNRPKQNVAHPRLLAVEDAKEAQSHDQVVERELLVQSKRM